MIRCLLSCPLYCFRDGGILNTDYFLRSLLCSLPLCLLYVLTPSPYDPSPDYRQGLVFTGSSFPSRRPPASPFLFYEIRPSPVLDPLIVTRDERPTAGFPIVV